MFRIEDISGTIVNYYVTCVREAWLYSRHIHADQNYDTLAMGRVLAQIREDGKELGCMFSHLKIDRLDKINKHYLITEYKKSMNNPEAAKMQLLFYMYLFKRAFKLRKIDGKVISGKKVLFVEGSEDAMNQMEALLVKIADSLSNPTPPPYKSTKLCKKCAYQSYCES